ncbi:MAG: EAL domain-containing protein [Cyanobium sp.]
MTTIQSNRLRSVLGSGELAIRFQPIVSLKQKRMIGLEALARPEGMDVGRAFALAQATGCLLDFDRLCRQTALVGYAELLTRVEPSASPLLFLNFEASVIDDGAVGSGALREATRSAGVDPTNVVLEINESRVRNDHALRRFVEDHRQHGFLIALDDLGAGHSNLARIAELRPQIIKLDRSLISGLDRDFVQQETVKSLARLGQSIGALVLAEGVETLEEVNACAVHGIDLFQGFVFSRPRPAEQLSLEPQAQDPLLHAAAQDLRAQAVRRLQERRGISRQLENLAAQGRQALMDHTADQFEWALASLVEQTSAVEAVYLLDHQGQQLGRTHLGTESKVVPNRLFAPSSHGTDHSCKDYFFSLMDTGMELFTTDSYISLATGNVCRTVSIAVNHSEGSTYVLCLDINTQHRRRGAPRGTGPSDQEALKR